MNRHFPVSQIIDNYDGDTVKVVLDLGFSILMRKTVRLADINTPEIRGGTDQTKARAREAKRLTSEWLVEHMDGLVFSCEKWQGKYGRAIGDFVPSDQGPTLVAYLKDNGF